MVGSMRKSGSKGGDSAAEDGLKYYRIYVRDSLGTHPVSPRFMGIILGNQGEPDPQEGDQLGELDRVKIPLFTNVTSNYDAQAIVENRCVPGIIRGAHDCVWSAHM
jgi:hypothetical protein